MYIANPPISSYSETYVTSLEIYRSQFFIILLCCGCCRFVSTNILVEYTSRYKRKDVIETVSCVGIRVRAHTNTHTQTHTHTNAMDKYSAIRQNNLIQYNLSGGGGGGGTTSNDQENIGKAKKGDRHFSTQPYHRQRIGNIRNLYKPVSSARVSMEARCALYRATDGRYEWRCECSDPSVRKYEFEEKNQILHSHQFWHMWKVDIFRLRVADQCIHR